MKPSLTIATIALVFSAIFSLGFACLPTAAVAESAQSSLDSPSVSVEATLSDLKSRLEQLEYRVGRQNTFQGRGAVGRAANDATN
jgi:hypothetical protein